VAGFESRSARPHCPAGAEIADAHAAIVTDNAHVVDLPLSPGGTTCFAWAAIA
jgi:hypothetical protein